MTKQAINLTIHLMTPEKPQCFFCAILLSPKFPDLNKAFANLVVAFVVTGDQDQGQLSKSLGMLSKSDGSKLKSTKHLIGFRNKHGPCLEYLKYINHKTKPHVRKELVYWAHLA